MSEEEKKQLKYSENMVYLLDDDNMNKEEKQAIEYLDKYSKITRNNETPTSNSIKISLKLIDKQQKIIDKIAESWKQDDIRSKEEIKEYFTKLVEQEDKNNG